MKLGTWFLSLVQPLIARLLLSLGFSVVTITGMQLTINALKDQWVSSVNQMPADILNVFLLAGGGIAAGLILGAITTRILIWQIMNATKILGVNPG
jgi:Protein of unknown function (DUF2523)